MCERMYIICESESVLSPHACRTTLLGHLNLHACWTILKRPEWSVQVLATGTNHVVISFV